jgi:hypothetical protein
LFLIITILWKKSEGSSFVCNVGSEGCNTIFPRFQRGRVLDDDVWLLESQPVQNGLSGLSDELGQGQFKAIDRRLGFGDFNSLVSRHSACAFIETDLSNLLGQTLDHPDASLRMAHFHSDVQTFNLHARGSVSIGMTSGQP